MKGYFVVPALAVVGCFAAVSNAIAVEINYTAVQERSGETIEIEQDVVEGFRALQEAALESNAQQEAAEEASAAESDAVASEEGTEVPIETAAETTASSVDRENSSTLLGEIER